MTRAQFIRHCLTYPGAVADRPFPKENTTILRHSSSRKWFALIFERESDLYVNLKCDPLEAILLRQSFRAVTPGWHMNKTHWITVRLNCDLADDPVFDLVAVSYTLTGTR